MKKRDMDRRRFWGTFGRRDCTYFREWNARSIFVTGWASNLATATYTPPSSNYVDTIDAHGFTAPDFELPSFLLISLS